MRLVPAFAFAFAFAVAVVHFFFFNVLATNSCAFALANSHHFSSRYRGATGDYESLIKSCAEKFLESNDMLADLHHFHEAVEMFCKTKAMSVKFGEDLLECLRDILERLGDILPMKKKDDWKGVLWKVITVLVRVHELQDGYGVIPSASSCEDDLNPTEMYARTLSYVAEISMSAKIFTKSERGAGNGVFSSVGDISQATKKSMQAVISSTETCDATLATNGAATFEEAYEVVGCLLGIYLSTSKIETVPSCGRYDCDCGYSKETGGRAIMERVINLLMEAGDYLTISGIIHTMETEHNYIKADVVDHLSEKIIHKMWDFNSSSSVKATAKDKRFSFMAFPISAITRWVRLKRSNLSDGALRKLNLKMLDEEAFTFLRVSVKNHLEMVLNWHLNGSSFNADTRLYSSTRTLSSARATALKNKVCVEALLDAPSSVVSDDDKVSIVKSLTLLEPTIENINYMKEKLGNEGFTDQFKEKALLSFTKLPDISIAVRIETLISFEAYKEVKKMFSEDKGDIKTATAVLGVLASEQTKSLASESEPFRKEVLSSTVAWAIRIIKLMANTGNDSRNLKNPSADCVSFSTWRSSGSTSGYNVNFREHALLSNVFLCLELALDLLHKQPGSGSAAGKERLKAFKKDVDKMRGALKSLRIAIEGNIAFAVTTDVNNKPIKHRGGGRRGGYSYNNDKTSTCFVGYPGFCPPQVLLSARHIVRALTEMTEEADGKCAPDRSWEDEMKTFYPWCTNQVMMSFRVREDSDDTRGELDCCAYMRLMVEDGIEESDIDGGGNCESRFTRFVESVRDQAWGVLKDGKVVIGKTQWDFSSYYLDDVLLVLSCFFLAYLETAEGMKRSSLFVAKSQQTSFRKYLKSQSEVVLSEESEEKVGACFCRHGLFEKASILALGELRAKFERIGSQIAVTQLKSWLLQFKLVGNHKTYPFRITNNATSIRNNFIGPLICMMWHPNPPEHDKNSLKGAMRKCTTFESRGTKKGNVAFMYTLTDVYTGGEAGFPSFAADVRCLLQTFSYCRTCKALGLLIVELEKESKELRNSGIVVESIFAGDDGMSVSSDEAAPCFVPGVFRSSTSMLAPFGCDWFVASLNDLLRTEASNCGKKTSSDYTIRLATSFLKFYYNKFLLCTNSNELEQQRSLSIYDASDGEQYKTFFDNLSALLATVSALKVPPKTPDSDFARPLQMAKFLLEPSSELLGSIKKKSSDDPVVATFLDKCMSIRSHQLFLCSEHLRDGAYEQAGKTALIIMQDEPSVTFLDEFFGTLTTDVPKKKGKEEVVSALLTMMPSLGWLKGYIDENVHQCKCLDVNMLAFTYTYDKSATKDDILNLKGEYAGGPGISNQGVKRVVKASINDAIPRNVRLKIIDRCFEHRKAIWEICEAVGGEDAATVQYFLDEGWESYEILVKAVGKSKAKEFACQCMEVNPLVGPEIALRRFELCGRLELSCDATYKCCFMLSEDRKEAATKSILLELHGDNGIASKSAEFKNLVTSYKPCMLAATAVILTSSLFYTDKAQTTSGRDALMEVKKTLIKWVSSVSNGWKLAKGQRTYINDPRWGNWVAMNSSDKSGMIDIVNTVVLNFQKLNVEKNYSWVGSFYALSDSYTDINANTNWWAGHEKNYWLSFLLVIGNNESKFDESVSAKSFMDKLGDFACDIMSGVKIVFTGSTMYQSHKLKYVLGSKFRDNLEILEKSELYENSAELVGNSAKRESFRLLLWSSVEYLFNLTLAGLHEGSSYSRARIDSKPLTQGENAYHTIDKWDKLCNNHDRL